MSMYHWDELEDVPITPSHTPSSGKVIIGKSLILQRILNEEDRGDGVPGATAHSHPEEQLIINLSKKKKMRVGNKWYTMQPGDVVLIPSYVEHEGTSEQGNLSYNIRNRMVRSFVDLLGVRWMKHRTIRYEIEERV